MHYANTDFWHNNVIIYNNPYLRYEGTDQNGKPYRRSYVYRMKTPKYVAVFGYVSGGNRILQVTAGQTLPAGSILVYFSRNEVATWDNDFYKANPMNGYGSQEICFVELEEPLNIGGYSGIIVFFMG